MLRNKFRYLPRGIVAGVYLFCISLIPQAYCTQFNGLRIDLLRFNRKAAQIGETKSISKLTDIEYPSNPGGIEKASYALLQDDTLSDSDTDDEEGSLSGDVKNALTENKKLDRLPTMKEARNQYNRSRRAPGGHKLTYDLCNNYLKEEIEPNKLLCQLSSDAFDIVGSEPNPQTQKSTVCLCAALRNKHGYVKKFTFHNGVGVMSPAMRTKAHELGYDVIQTQQSHAEGQLIQFLLDRHQRRPGWYTHIMGMGCSRCHCVECNALLELFLGKDYDKFTASINTKKNTEKAENTVDTSLDAINTRISDIQITKTDQDGFCLTKTIERSATVVFGLDAVGKGTFDKFYLPLVLRDAINEKLPQELDFQNERFIKSEE